MPWPTSSSRREGCGYVMCGCDGHSVCWHFDQYYQRLCAAVAVVTADPNPEHLAALQAVFDENQGAVHE